MIYFCVKTEEYLTAILDKVAIGAEYYCQFDVPIQKAESVIEKFTQRYQLNQTTRQRNYRLNKNFGVPVVDLIVLCNRSLKSINTVRLCLLCTIPPYLRSVVDKCEFELATAYKLADGEKERFNRITDRKNRLIYMSITGVEVYELVDLMFTKEERKQKNMESVKAWTWRLHKNFISLRLENFRDAFKKAQKLKSKGRFNQIEKEYLLLRQMTGFRGVRKDIFEINRKTLSMSFTYLNQRNEFELKVPAYIKKSKRLVRSFNEMISFVF